MIIQIRGTSGSGKSTAMRAVMAHYKWTPVFVEGRKRPLYYFSEDRSLVVLGHYEIDCGGCDTIGSAPDVYNTIKELPRFPASIILSEGLLWGEDVKWTLELAKEEIIHAFFLTTGLETCLEWVKKRQDGREPTDPDRVVRKLSKRIDTIESARRRLINQHNVFVHSCSARQAPERILNLLSRSL